MAARHPKPRSAWMQWSPFAKTYRGLFFTQREWYFAHLARQIRQKKKERNHEKNVCNYERQLQTVQINWKKNIFQKGSRKHRRHEVRTLQQRKRWKRRTLKWGLTEYRGQHLIHLTSRFCCFSPNELCGIGWSVYKTFVLKFWFQCHRGTKSDLFWDVTNCSRGSTPFNVHVAASLDFAFCCKNALRIFK